LLCDRGGAVVERLESPLLRLLLEVLRPNFNAVMASVSLPQSIAAEVSQTARLGRGKASRNPCHCVPARSAQ